MAREKTPSTRNEILTMLKLKGSLTVSEMAGRLEITEMAVRRHLNTLERDRLVETRMVRQAMGRPTHVYSLTDESERLFPNNYPDLTLDILQDIKDVEGEEKIASLFQRREERMAASYKNQVWGDSLEIKVKQLAHIQNQKGYMVEYVVDENTGDIVFTEYNCPISQVAREFHHACGAEHSLFRKVLQTEVIQQECMAKGEDRCVYIIKNNKKSTP